jgi:hypothetical protein
MRNLAKALVGTVAVGAVAVSATAPAFARDVYLGAASVVAAPGPNHRSGERDNRDAGRYGAGRHDGGRYDQSRYGIDPRSAVAQCVAAATRTANRYSYGGRAKVTHIRDVDRRNYGYTVEGRIAVNAMGRDWRSSDGRYGRGWGNDYRGWNSAMRGYDAGTFSCRVDNRGRVADLDFSGIRGL